VAHALLTWLLVGCSQSRLVSAACSGQTVGYSRQYGSRWCGSQQQHMCGVEAVLEPRCAAAENQDGHTCENNMGRTAQMGWATPNWVGRWHRMMRHISERVQEQLAAGETSSTQGFPNLPASPLSVRPCCCRCCPACCCPPHHSCCQHSSPASASNLCTTPSMAPSGMARHGTVSTALHGKGGTGS
jgi:hypothetical protein